MKGSRGWGLVAALFGCAAALACLFDGRRAIVGWLVWRYLGQAIGAALFALLCLAAGTRVLARVVGEQHPCPDAAERAELPGCGEEDPIAFALGLLAGALFTFLAGLVGLLDPRGFVLVVIALAWLGQPAAPTLWARFRAWWGRPSLWTSGELALLLAGGVSCVAIYLPILSPTNASYDARWYHLGLAEHDVALGALRPHPEGVVQATISSVPSLLYTWCFLLPGGSLFDRLGLAAHLELSCFVATLAAIPVLVRRVLPTASGRLSWTAMFLFPAIFQYDTALVSGADHIAAALAIPLLLVTFRVCERGEPRAYALWAILVGGLFVTKYSAVIAAVGPAGAVCFRLLRDSLRERTPESLLRRLAILAGCLLATTAPVWLRNLIFHGDPLYPLLHRWFSPRPFGVDGPAIVEAFRAEAFVPSGPMLAQLGGAVRALGDHSFGLYNWESFHGRWPVFGSLFSCTVLVLPFLRDTQRIWFLVLAAHAAIPAWFFVGHQERYLQVVVPWMAAAVAATAHLSWRRGDPAARAGLVALLGVQIAWGADVYFWPVHHMTGKAGIAGTVELLGAAYRGEDVTKRSFFKPWTDIATTLPPRARVLAHHEHVRLGIGAPSVGDSFPHQHGIAYGRLGSLPAILARLRQMRVTHVVWQADALHRDESLASEILFHDLVSQLPEQRAFGSHRLAALPSSVARPASQTVAVLPCAGRTRWAPGLYRLEDLAGPPPPHIPGQPAADFVPPLTPPAPLPDSLVGSDTYVLRDPNCGAAPADGRARLGLSEGWELWGPASARLPAP